MSRTRNTYSRSLFAFLGIALLASIGACAPTIDTRGNRPDKVRMSKVKPGQTTRSQVLRLLGSPSTIATFDRNTWLYISKTEKLRIVRKPRTTSQLVIAIKFNKSGVVESVKRLNLNDAKDVKYVERRTPTRGGEPGLLESLYKTLVRGPLGSLPR